MEMNARPMELKISNKFEIMELSVLCFLLVGVRSGVAPDAAWF